MKFPRYSSYVESGVEWVGPMPAHWRYMPVWLMFELGRGRVVSHEEILDNSGEFPVYSSQTENNGEMGALNTFDFEGDYLTWTTDGANAGTVFRRAGKFNCTNVCGTLKPSRNEIDLGYMVHAVGLSTSSYVRQDINPKLMNNVMAKIRVPVPPLVEQIIIASLLDQETSKIDALITEQQRLIELLKEKRQAVISHSVTKGLNPDVWMKPSGVEWLGEVPGHWDVGPLSKLTTSKTGFAFNSEDFTDEGIAVLRIGDIKSDGSVDFSEAKYLPIEVIQQRSDVIVESGDIVMAMTGATIGKASTYGYEAPALLNQRVCRFRARNSESQRFVYYSLLSRYYTEKVVITACGGAQPNISDQQLRLFRVAIPPLPEQLEIGDYICREVARIDSLSKEAENGIALLQERRTALISAAVTGKIDVRNYASTQKDAA